MVIKMPDEMMTEKEAQDVLLGLEGRDLLVMQLDRAREMLLKAHDEGLPVECIAFVDHWPADANNIQRPKFLEWVFRASFK